MKQGIRAQIRELNRLIDITNKRIANVEIVIETYIEMKKDSKKLTKFFEGKLDKDIKGDRNDKNNTND